MSNIILDNNCILDIVKGNPNSEELAALTAIMMSMQNNTHTNIVAEQNWMHIEKFDPWKNQQSNNTWKYSLR